VSPLGLGYFLGLSGSVLESQHFNACSITAPMEVRASNALRRASSQADTEMLTVFFTV
jgi:hypothetical protein